MSIKNLHLFIREQLNTPQQEAVLKKEGPILVIAGAGSGKTRVITTRIAYLMLTHNVPARSIIALTFTNKAAREMRERIAQFLPPDTVLPFIGTFHAYSLVLLKKYARELVPFTSILDEDDKTKLLTAILQKYNLQKQLSVKQIRHQISDLKNNFINPQQTVQQGHWGHQSLLAQIYHAYEHDKSLHKTLDFDDLLLETLRLFEKNASFSQAHQSRIKHLLVDEYQDTNIIQHALLKQMCLDKNQFIVESLCAVGDEDQSIYSWRGATVSNIMNFGRDFSCTANITLSQNYRSAQPILELANHIISKNEIRNHKNLFSEKKGFNCFYHLVASSEYKEAEMIAAAINRAQIQNPQSSIAILYRTHFQSRSLEEALIKKSISYKIVGGIQFYERKEIKDLLAYLKLIVNPFDRLSLNRILNEPTRGLGDKCQEIFSETWITHPLSSFLDIGRIILEQHIITGKRAAALDQFLTLFKELSSDVLPSAALSYFIQKTGYVAYIKNNYEPEEANQKIENIHELINAIAHFESQGMNSIEQFLDEVALLQDHTNSSEIDQRVLLMTLHAAKGLEFDFVIIAGLEENIFPSARSLLSPELTEEERRLLYVGITRAKEKLLLTRARSRYTFGQLNRQNQSRFLVELHNILPQQSCEYWDLKTAHDFFKEWFDPTNSALKHKQAPSQKSLHTWKLYQTVHHTNFGLGTIQKIEERGSQFFLTIQFNKGTKKIESSFITLTRI